MKKLGKIIIIVLGVFSLLLNVFLLITSFSLLDELESKEKELKHYEVCNSSDYMKNVCLLMELEEKTK